MCRNFPLFPVGDGAAAQGARHGPPGSAAACVLEADPLADAGEAEGVAAVEGAGAGAGVIAADGAEHGWAAWIGIGIDWKQFIGTRNLKLMRKKN